MGGVSVMTTNDGVDRKAAAKTHQWKIIAASFAAIVMFNAMPAFGFLARPVLFAALGGITKAPGGWLQFCAENPDECRPTGEASREITLTPDLLQQLFSINAHANDRVKWTSDAELYGKTEHWAYPLDRGDCEDIVLLKRRLLANAGWPLGNLLITTVEDRNADNGRHAVLTVRTDRGELILDNQTPEILFWYETSYRFLTRQSTADPNVWIAFSANQPRPGAAPAAR
jgi:predicted transglutaminase-like cysteine proteinase